MADGASESLTRLAEDEGLRWLLATAWAAWAQGDLEEAVGELTRAAWLVVLAQRRREGSGGDG